MTAAMRSAERASLAAPSRPHLAGRAYSLSEPDNV